MKLFTQLALVSAIAASGSALAMQSMDDTALSATTGQDGITIVIAPPTLTAAQQTVSGQAVLTQTKGLIIGAAVLHDKDGLTGITGATALEGGAIILGDASQANAANAVGTQMGIFGTAGIQVDIDASGGGAAHALTGSAPVLNVKLSLPTDLLIRTGDISVAGSARSAIATGAAGAIVANAATGGTTGISKKILNSMDIALGGATMNIQLANTPQGAMIVAGGTIKGGLSISNLGLIDGTAGTAGGGTLGVSVITLKDTGTAKDLTLDAKIDVTADVGLAFGGASTSRGGLVIAMGASSGAVGNDIMMQNITLGSANSTLGDLQLINVQTAGTRIAIMGH